MLKIYFNENIQAYKKSLNMLDTMQSASKILKFGRISWFHLATRSASKWNCSSLIDRSVLKVTGVEAPTFLQGLMTNDIDILVENERKRYVVLG